MNLGHTALIFSCRERNQTRFLRPPRSPLLSLPLYNNTQQPCANVSPFIWARPASRLVTDAGSYIASSTASSLMAKCPRTRPSAVEMMRSTPSSLRQALESTCPALFMLTLSRPFAMRSDLAPTVSSITLSRSSAARKMLPTTTLVDTTLLARRSLILSSIASASSLTTARVFKDSLSSMLLVVVPGLALDRSSSRGFPLTMGASPSFLLQFRHHPRFRRQLSSLITLFSPPTPSWSTQTVLFALTTRPSMTSAVVTLTLKGRPTPT
mmetsp:Transcript_55766/g.167114  ORF Transcript_55766/g.167114 Transcript_55766/m.167114 type:complete len:267 (+) Transcript_55766:35-835(+)